MNFLDLLRKPVIGTFFRVALSITQTVLSWFIKKDKSIVVACPQGVRYADNGKYFFEHLHKNHTDVCLLTSSQTMYSTLAEKYPDHVVYSFSSRGIRKYIAASVLVYSYGKRDFYPFQLTKSKTIVNLWHGNSVKKIALASKMSALNNSKLKKEIKKIDFFIASSETEAETLIQCFNLKPTQIKITGLPRNDYLLANDYNQTLLGDYPWLTKKTILYAPTFRKTGSTNIIPFNDYDLDTLNSFLLKNDAYLLVRKHHSEWFNNKEGYDAINSYSNIINAGQDAFPEIQELLPFVDILVTDYSGIYFDYLLLDRPMIFAPYDIESFSQKPGFLFDYNKNTPGPKVNSQQIFINELFKVFSGNDEYIAARKSCRDKFHLHQDGQSSERILNLIKNKLN